LALQFILGGVSAPALASYVQVPSTVSPVWQEALRAMPDPNLGPSAPGKEDIAGWKALYLENEKKAEPYTQKALKLFQPSVARRKIGEVEVLDIKPRGWKDNGLIAIYTHGGAY